MQTTFADVLEAVESLPAEEKVMLVDIVRSRLIEEGRARLRREIDQADQEFASGSCTAMTADEFMNEAIS